MKAIITGDIHLGIGKNDPIWLKQSIRLFSSIVDECHRRNIDWLFVLGDIFHDRKTIGVETLNTALEIANILEDNNINCIFLVGNHDSFRKNNIDINSVKIFDKYSNITNIYKPTTMFGNIGFTSWSDDKPDMNVDYLFGHFEINDFLMSDYIVSQKAKLNINNFARYKKVYSGHYHIP